MQKFEIAGYKRIDKKVARKYYDSGIGVYALGGNIRPDNPWEVPILLNENKEKSFDDILNMLSYYNHHWKTVWFWITPEQEKAMTELQQKRVAK